MSTMLSNGGVNHCCLVHSPGGCDEERKLVDILNLMRQIILLQQGSIGTD